MKEADHKSIFDKLTKKSAILIALCASPLFFLFAYLGDPGRGRAAAVCAFVLLTCARLFWNILKPVWLWLTIAIVVICHVPLITLVSWTNKDYPGIVLLPIALLDFVVVYGAFWLLEKTTRGAKESA
jgi:hypothetical protein